VTAREETVALELVQLAREVLELDGPAPLPDEPLAGRLDSLQLLTLVVAIEDRFRVILTDDDTVGASTLADVARLVVARTGPASGPVPAPAEEVR
jgi:acyl carrier protein